VASAPALPSLVVGGASGRSPLAVVKKSVSTPTLPAVGDTGSPSASKDIYTKRWTNETKRLLHQHRERSWLQTKALHNRLDFSEAERLELRHYFEELADKSSRRLRIDKLETMLISLGLAENRKEVDKILQRIDCSVEGELDFEEYLDIVRTRTSSNIYHIFKAMMEGQLGDRDLNFQTVISEYRRHRILDATGANPGSPSQQTHGVHILHNFAELQRSRSKEARGSSRTGTPKSLSSPSSQGVTSPSGASAVPHGLFTHSGQAPVGGLGMIWRGICHENGLVESRPNSVDGRSRRTARPPSPSAVVASIVKERRKDSKRVGGAHGTVVLQVPALEEGGAGSRPPSGALMLGEEVGQEAERFALPDSATEPLGRLPAADSQKGEAWLEWAKVGHAHQRKKNFAQAHNAYTNALKRDATQHACLACLAQLEAHAGNIEEARTFLKRALALSPDDTAYIAFGRWLQREKGPKALSRKA